MATATITHKFVSPYTEAVDPTVIDGVNWNDGHLFSGGTAGQMLVAAPTEASGVAFMDVAPGFPNPMTTLGDLIVGQAGGVPDRLPLGASWTMLQAFNGLPYWSPDPTGRIYWFPETAATPSGSASWVALYAKTGTDRLYYRNGVGQEFLLGEPTGGGMDNPMTTVGDLIVGATGGAPARLGIGAAGQVLTVVAGTPAWQPAAGGGAPVNATYVTLSPHATLTNESVLAAGTGLSLAGSTLSLDATTGTAALNVFTAALKGLAPASGGGMTNFLRADATWAAPPGGGGGAPVDATYVTTSANATLTAEQVLGVGTGLTLTGATVSVDSAAMTAALNLFTSTLRGLTPASGGGTTNFLRADGTWAPGGMANPMTAAQDLIVGAVSGTPARLAVGTNTQVLTVTAGTVGWATPAAPGMANPMTASGDLIRGGTSGAPTRLAVGTDGQVLTLASGLPAWAAAVGFSNPMTTAGDLIRGGTSGAPTRLAIGSNGQFLTVSGGALAWGAALANPMTTAQDLIVGGAAGTPTRLAVGSNTQVLTVTAGTVGWAAGGLTNPMTSVGDVIIGGAGGTPTRLAAVATGQVFISKGVDVAPAWSTDPAIRNLLLQGGTVGTSGVGVLALGPGTAPTTSPVDTVQCWAEDLDAEAGSRSFALRDERGGTLQLGSKADTASYLRLRPVGTGPTLEAFTYAGGTGISVTSASYSFSLVQAGTTKFGIRTDGYVDLWIGGLSALRSVTVGAVDSGGVGYRNLIVPN